MIRRCLRLAALLVLVVWVAWDIASESPEALLWLAFVAAWGLLIDFFAHSREDRERAKKGEVGRLELWLPFLVPIAVGVALLISSDDTVEQVFGAAFVAWPMAMLIYAFGAAFRSVRRERREGG